MKSKVLFIMHTPPPVHGAAVVGQNIKDSSLINELFDCDYINPTMAKELQDIARIDHNKLINFIKLIRTIFKMVRNNNYQLCYFTPTAKKRGFYKSFLIVMWLKILGQRVIVHFHNKGVKERQHLLIDNILYKLFFNNIKVILLAEELYLDIKKYVDKKDTYICPNGIKEISVENTSHKDRNTFRILFLSNIMKEKGVWYLLEACKILKKTRENFICDFVGGWSDISQHKIKTYLSKYDLNEIVKFHGPKYGKEKEDFFECSDLFVFPTYYHNECFPLVLLEAMQFGLPCISTPEGGIEGIIKNGQTGFIVEKKNSEQIADKIRILIDDKSFYEEMSFLSKKRFEKNFRLEKFEERFLEILSSVISS